MTNPYATDEITEYIHITRTGWLRWEWEAIGVLTRSLETGGMVYLPTGHSQVVSQGTTFTARGASRRGHRALRRYCQVHDPANVIVEG